MQPVHPVLEYTKATGLQPILLALGGEDRYTHSERDIGVAHILCTIHTHSERDLRVAHTYIYI